MTVRPEAESSAAAQKKLEGNTRSDLTSESDVDKELTRLRAENARLKKQVKREFVDLDEEAGRGGSSTKKQRVVIELDSD